MFELVRAVWRGRGAGMRRDALGGAISPRPVGDEPHGDGLAVGEYPLDLDAVPDWVRRCEAWHASIGRRFPTPRTRREMDLALERLRRDLEPEVETELLPPLPPDESAKRFLGFLRASMDDTETTLVLTPQDVTDAYLEWCQSEHRHPSPDNFVRAALKRLPGVTPHQVRVPGPGRKRTWTLLVDRCPQIERVEMPALRVAA